MCLTRNNHPVFLAGIFSITLAFFGSAHGLAQTCVPPSGFIDIPAPAVAAAEQLVSHVEETTINHPLAGVLISINKPLKDGIKRAGSLPGVSGEYMLTQGPFGHPGSRRIVCLTDGSTLQEQAMVRDRTDTSFHFHYVVWHYTSPQARPIEYGVGDFLYTDLGNGRTHVVWTYSFKLKDHEFPGYLGAFGRYLFRIGFLDRQYAAMMRGTLDGTKKSAEQ